ncbi:hypothetical protein J3F83DRAFT_729575 [Trichoderma novae-zelandiae]
MFWGPVSRIPRESFPPASHLIYPIPSAAGQPPINSTTRANNQKKRRHTAHGMLATLCLHYDWGDGSCCIGITRLLACLLACWIVCFGIWNLECEIWYWIWFSFFFASREVGLNIRKHLGRMRQGHDEFKIDGKNGDWRIAHQRIVESRY